MAIPTIKGVKPGDVVIPHRFGARFLEEGDKVSIYGRGPRLPRWTKRWWAQDGDIAIATWLCNLFGWLDDDVVIGTFTIASISGNEITLDTVLP